MSRAPLLYPQTFFPFFWKQNLSPALLTKCHSALVNKATRSSFLRLQALGGGRRGLCSAPPGPLPSPSFLIDPSPCPHPHPISQGEAKPKQAPKLSCSCLLPALAWSSGGRGTGEITGGTLGEEE